MPAAAAFVIEECLPSWNGLIGLVTPAALSAARRVTAYRLWSSGVPLEG